MPRQPIVRAFLICEDVRQEVNGKVALLGIYGDTINFLTDLPAVLDRLGFFFALDAKAVSGKKLTLKFFPPNSRKPMFEISGKIPKLDATGVNFSPLINNAQFKKEGRYRVTLAIDGKNVFSTPIFVTRQRG